MTPSPPDRPVGPDGRGPTEAGSVLLLFPAAILVVVVLAAIAVDSAIAFLAQREVANAVTAAANDAAGEGVSNGAFYRGGRVDLDGATVEQLATERVMAALDGDRFRDVQVGVTVHPPASPGCPSEVEVEATARVATLFAAALPGNSGDVGVGARAIGRPLQAPLGC